MFLFKSLIYGSVYHLLTHLPSRKLTFALLHRHIITSHKALLCIFKYQERRKTLCTIADEGLYCGLAGTKTGIRWSCHSASCMSFETSKGCESSERQNNNRNEWMNSNLNEIMCQLFEMFVCNYFNWRNSWQFCFLFLFYFFHSINTFSFLFLK